MGTDTLDLLRDDLRNFARERDWEQFHTPKNLVMALCVEAAELMEHFQWLTPQQSAHLTPQKRQQVADELADVLIYLARLADVLEIDLAEAATQKMLRNAEKYPVEKAKGVATKYTELDQEQR